MLPPHHPREASESERLYHQVQESQTLSLCDIDGETEVLNPFPATLPRGPQLLRLLLEPYLYVET